MPSLYYRVEAPGVNILKTVTDEVVFGLLDEFYLTDSMKNSVYTTSSFETNSQYDNGEGTQTLIKNRCDVEVNYILDPAQVPWPNETPYNTAAYGLRADQKGRHTPILIDKKAQIFIEHYTVPCAIEMAFTLTFTTFDEATRAMMTIQSKYKGSLFASPFDLSFGYPMSMGLLEYLYCVYKAKTDFQSKTLFDYLNAMKTTAIDVLVRKEQLASPVADQEILIRCMQLNCPVQLTMDQKEPTADKLENLPATYTIDFTYVIQFGRPDKVAVHTPVSVDNTPLPASLFSNILIKAHDNPWVGGVFQDLLINEFARRSFGDYNNTARIMRIPAYDDWVPKDPFYKVYQYQPFLIAHFTLDGPTSTINLRQLDDIVLHPVVQDIMTTIGTGMFTPGGLFTISVYADDLLLSPNLLALNSDLNLTITSSRPDKVYHLVLSESTVLRRLSEDWNALLIKYRYFFPMTIERNIGDLVKNGYFKIDYDNSLLSLISNLGRHGTLKERLAAMVAAGEDTNEIYSYTQNPSQLADYMALNSSHRRGYQVPTGTDAVSVMLQTFYSSYTSTFGRSLLVAFLEQCLIAGDVTLDTLPAQYLDPNATIYPYYPGEGGYYGFNSPIRIFNYNIRA